MKKLILSAVIACALTGIAFRVNAAETSVTGTVNALFVLSDGEFIIYPSTTPTGCSNTLTVTIGQNSVNEQAASLLYTTALTSFVKAKSVQIFYDNVSCYVNRILLTN